MSKFPASGFWLAASFLACVQAVHGAAATYVDNGTPGYATTGAWTSQSIAGRYNSNWQFQNTANGAETATWTFTGLAPGNYVASTTTYAQANLSTNALYTLSDGGGAYNRDLRFVTNHFDIDGGVNNGQPFARFSSFGGYTPINITDGNFVVTLTDLDPAAFLVADAIRLESVRAGVQKIYLIGNGDPGYSETSGAWNVFAGDVGDHGADFRFSSGLATDQVTVTFSGIDAGLYRISTAWTAGANRPTNVTLGYSTVGSSGSTSYNQIPGAAAHDVFEEVNWQDMFTNVTVTSGSLTLTLTNTSGNGLMIADGFRLEKIPEPSAAALGVCAFAGLFLRRRRLIHFT